MKNLKIAFLSAMIMVTTGNQGFGSDFLGADEGKSSGAGFESSDVVNWNDALLAQTRGVIRQTISASGLLTSVPGTMKFVKAVRAVEDALCYSIDNGSGKYSQDYNSIVADYNNFNAQISQLIEGRTWIDEDTGFASDDAPRGSVGAKGWSMEREGAGHQLKRGVKLKSDVAAIYALKNKILSSLEAIDAKAEQDKRDQLQLLSAPEAAQQEITDSLRTEMQIMIASRVFESHDTSIAISTQVIEILREIQGMLSSGAKISTMSAQAQEMWTKIAVMGTDSRYNTISKSGEPVKYGFAKARVSARVDAMIDLEGKNIIVAQGLIEEEKRAVVEAAQKEEEERVALEVARAEEERAARELAQKEEEAKAKAAREAVREEAQRMAEKILKIRDLSTEAENLNIELGTIKSLLKDKSRPSKKGQPRKDFDTRTARVSTIESRLQAIQSELENLNA